MSLAEDIVARRVSPIEGAWQMWKRVYNEDWVLMHEYKIFFQVAELWYDSPKGKAGDARRSELEAEIIREAQRVIRRSK